MKATKIDKEREGKRESALAALKKRGAISKEKTIANLRARLALIEEILGITYVGN